mmetsp:Transcript_40620/g.94986  ORF Transcript_40620/g.94986 Transcript_40620/m.94986 type:complete len:223 (+) Transcript_40620:209-877(+)
MGTPGERARAGAASAAEGGFHPEGRPAPAVGRPALGSRPSPTPPPPPPLPRRALTAQPLPQAGLRPQARSLARPGPTRRRGRRPLRAFVPPPSPIPPGSEGGTTGGRGASGRFTFLLRLLGGHCTRRTGRGSARAGGIASGTAAGGALPRRARLDSIGQNVTRITMGTAQSARGSRRGLTGSLRGTATLASMRLAHQTHHALCAPPMQSAPQSRFSRTGAWA